jgi:multidrug efflux pump subunit AcrB
MISIGILVDDAIVVVENIHRWQTLEPDKPLWQLIPRPSTRSAGRPSWPPSR